MRKGEFQQQQNLYLLDQINDFLFISTKKKKDERQRDEWKTNGFKWLQWCLSVLYFMYRRFSDASFNMWYVTCYLLIFCRYFFCFCFIIVLDLRMYIYYHRWYLFCTQRRRREKAKTGDESWIWKNKINFNGKRDLVFIRNYLEDVVLLK